jgi:hypothetical protein
VAGGAVVAVVAMVAGAVVATKLIYQTTHVACATSVIEAEASVTLASFLIAGIWNLILCSVRGHPSINSLMDVLTLLSDVALVDVPCFSPPEEDKICGVS